MRARYQDVTRCKECAENIPLLVSVLTYTRHLRYRCGECDTHFTVEAKRESDGALTDGDGD